MTRFTYIEKARNRMKCHGEEKKQIKLKNSKSKEGWLSNPPLILPRGRGGFKLVIQYLYTYSYKNPGTIQARKILF